MAKVSQKPSTKVAPKPGQPDLRSTFDRFSAREDVQRVRVGVNGIDPAVEAPSVPNPIDRVNAKALDITPHESGSGK